jgi:N4-gp56 family major capsid protein
MQNYSTVPSRNLIMAERTMLKRAEPIKVLSTFGTNKEVPQNKTDTVVFRRALPLDAASSGAATGAPQVNASDYLLQEGTTPTARTISYQDVTVTLQQYGVLLKLSSKAESLYEDDIPGDMTAIAGEHMGTIEEMISFGVVRGGTNVVFANGTVRTAVNTAISINKLRQVARNIESAHGKRVTEKLAAGPNFGTSAIHPAYLVFVHTDVEADVRNIPGFTPVVEYGQQKPVHEREIGAVEQFRFITSPYFRPWLLAGGTVTAGAFLSGGGVSTTTADVYPVMVVAQEAWGQVALKGMGSIDITYLPAKQKTHANPLGQFGYVGGTFWKNAVRTNENWMCRLEVAVSGL